MIFSPMSQENQGNNIERKNLSYKKISQEMRDIILRHYEHGIKVKTTSSILNISESTIYSILRNYWNTGCNTPKPRDGSKKYRILQEVKNFIIDKVREDSTLSDEQLMKLVKEKFNKDIHVSMIHYALGGPYELYQE